MKKSKKFRVFSIAILSLFLIVLAVFVCYKSGITSFSGTNAQAANIKADSSIGTVKIKYVDTNGKEISEESTQTGKIGEWYKTERKEIPTYKAYGDEPLNKRGYYSKDETVVEYVYQTASSVNLEESKVGEDNDITISVENERATREYDLFLKTICSKTKDDVSGAGIKVSKDSTEIKNEVSTKGEIYVGNITVKDETTSVYSFEPSQSADGYICKLAPKFDLKVIRKWNKDKNKFEISLEYDESTPGIVSVEIKDDKVFITIDYEEILGKYSMNIKTIDGVTNQAVYGAKFKVKSLSSSFEKNIEMQNEVEKIGDFDISKETDEIEYYELEQVSASNGVSQVLSEKLIIGVKKIVNLEKQKYEVQIIRNDSFSNVDIQIDENGNITIIILFDGNGEQDLAIKYYLTKINDEDVESREPKLLDGLKSIEEKTDFVKVKNNDELYFTARVYNNSTTASNGSSVKITIPKGLSFIPENQVNLENGWKAYIEREYGTLEETNDVSLANVLVSEKLVNESIEGINSNNEVSYLDLGLVLCVNDADLKDERNIVEIAQLVGLMNDTDDKNNIDFEYLYVKYFDLSITKYVEEVDILKGNKKTTKKYGIEEKDTIPKIEVRAKQIKTTKLKVKYGMRVKNVGELAGLALEISDYIPKGLKFNQVDNPGWYLDGDVLKTSSLNTLWLEPGESKTIYLVLEWDLDGEHLGQKVNQAKVTDYYGDGDSTDVTGDNNSKSPILVSVSTGAEVYTAIIVTMVGLIVVGIIILNKYGRKE